MSRLLYKLLTTPFWTPGTFFSLRYRWHGAFGCTGIALRREVHQCDCHANCAVRWVWETCPQCGRLQAKWQAVETFATTSTSMNAPMYVYNINAIYN